jgi:prepilin-type N-terminal cleavage/methylation domain-containing protein
MMAWKRGFTLVEVMIALVVMFIAMTAVSTFLVGTRGRGGVLNAFKQQGKIAQSGLDSIIGLEILRKDLEHAGYGVPWNNIPVYNEATSGILNDSPTAAPRGIVSVDAPAFTLNNADYLVIKASCVAMNDACRKWTTLQVGDAKRAWITVPANAENMNNTDQVIVMAPGSTGTNWRSLVIAGGAFATTYNNTAAFAPANLSDTRLVYGIDDASALRMPFNRADYYLSNANVPQHCAPNTGVLVKAVVDQADGDLDLDADGSNDEFPLLDCVASMQVQYMRDTDGDGTVDTPSDDISALSAQQIREQVRHVQVSILAHEGQRDPSYTHSPTNIPVGSTMFNVSPNVNYRWKVYELVVTPENLRS